MKTKKILITGGSGFLGRNIQERLSTKYLFLAPSHHELDLTNEKSTETFLRSNKVDLVIHCANIGGTRKTTQLRDILNVNLRMFFSLVRCRKYYQKMIFIGSGAEYDKRRSLQQIRENN